MIPTPDQCRKLFDRFNLPSVKRIHVTEVARVAVFLAQKLKAAGEDVNVALVEAAALLHDIDKAVPKKAGERHPDTGVRLLTDLGLTEVATIVRSHSVHSILDEAARPKSWEAKCVYLADKMVKHELVGIEHRFDLWFREDLPPQAVDELTASLPKVMALEQELYQCAKITYKDVVRAYKESL